MPETFLQLGDVQLVNDDFWQMLILFAINFFFTSIIIRQLYYRYTHRTDFVFTYYMVSIVLFFLCFTLKKFSLDLGMALGLFAIFGIIRYRTQTIDVKEMTYLFVIIGVSVINALFNTNMSIAEVLGANVTIVVSILVIERYVIQKVMVQRRQVIYDVLDNLKPENEEKLHKDLTQKTGLKITQVTIAKIDYANKMATINILYRK
jgi:hypothetical protein